MSNPSPPPGRSRTVTRVVRGQPASDGAGVRLTRVIGGAALPELDPFLLLDEFDSSEAGDYVAGFPDHPHRGFETVTYMLAGRMRHADSAGNSGLLTAGGVQWMTAGRGLVHSEMPEQERGRMQGFQLWVNLPAADKLCAPRYQDIPPAQVPVVEPAQGVRVRVIAGRFAGVEGPVRAVATEPLYLDVRLAPGARLDAALPGGHQAFAYVFEGEARIGEPQQAVRRGELAVLGAGDAVTLSADGAQAAASRLIVVAGRPLREPVARYGPFVMNTREQIVEAVRDFQAGRF